MNSDNGVRTVFVDESGYTGPDLLNRDQPILTVASLGCSEALCQELKGRFFIVSGRLRSSIPNYLSGQVDSK